MGALDRLETAHRARPRILASPGLSHPPAGAHIGLRDGEHPFLSEATTRGLRAPARRCEHPRRRQPSTIPELPELYTNDLFEPGCGRCSVVPRWALGGFVRHPGLRGAVISGPVWLPAGGGRMSVGGFPRETGTHRRRRYAGRPCEERGQRVPSFLETRGVPIAMPGTGTTQSRETPIGVSLRWISQSIPHESWQDIATRIRICASGDCAIRRAAR